MPESTPSFAQPERRSFAIPVLLALAVLVGLIAYAYHAFPNGKLDAIPLNTTYLPTHTVFKVDSKVVGVSQSEDELFIASTVRLTNHLRFAVTIDDVTCTFTDATGAVMTVQAAQKLDLPNVQASFPALKPMLAHPLLRESTINPGQQAEGTLLLTFPFTPDQWVARKSAVVTINFYHQQPVSYTIAK